MELSRESAVFRNRFEYCGELIEHYLGWSLEEQISHSLNNPSSSISEDRIEPINTAIQIAIHDFLKAHNVCPAAIISMSGGEFAAAYASGAIDGAVAMELVCQWSRAIVDRLATGATIRVRTGATEALEMASKAVDRVYLACDMDPNTCVLSTTCSNSAELLALFTDSGIECDLLPFSGGYHSPLVSGWNERVRPITSRIGPQQPRLPLYSSVSGALAQSVDLLHWNQVITAPALFRQACIAALSDGYDTFLNVSITEDLAALPKSIAARLQRPITIIESVSGVSSIERIRSL